MNNGLCGVHQGYAVAHNFDWGVSLLGPGWFGWGCPPHADGVRTAVFSKKKDALAAIKVHCKGSSGKFWVVPVQAIIVERRFLVKWRKSQK